MVLVMRALVSAVLMIVRWGVTNLRVDVRFFGNSGAYGLVWVIHRDASVSFCTDRDEWCGISLMLHNADHGDGMMVKEGRWSSVYIQCFVRVYTT
jgi:hypothetical protein